MIEITDEDVALVWGLHPVDCQCWKCATVPMQAVSIALDASHTSEHPFCNKADCDCHTDAALFDKYIYQPVVDGTLKIWEAQTLLWPER
jgi:hypothetical protein